MARTGEGKLQEKFIAYLESIPRERLWYHKVSDRIKRGILDIVLCVNGRFASIELKNPERKSESKSWPLQKRTINRILDSGGAAIATDRLQEAVDFVEWLLSLPRLEPYSVPSLRRYDLQ